MIVNLYRLPGNQSRVAVTTVTNNDLALGDIVQTSEEMEKVTGSRRWTVISIDSEKNEADAVAAT